MTRKQARDLAFKLLYQMDMQKETADAILEVYFEQHKIHQESKAFVENIIYGVEQQGTSIDSEIARHSEGWAVKRISKVVAAALRLAIYEMEYCEDVPNVVAINEAVELVKLYDCEESAGFVNGILGNILKEKTK